MKTTIYVDGFNLYFGSLKNTPYRWLDIAKLCSLLLPKNQIHQIKYFTALVKSRPNAPEKPIRQQAYLRALKTIPHLEIFLGHFLSHETMMPLATSWGNAKLKYERVIKTEEKGSDVNLATHLLADAFQNKFEAAAIISNDSDLLEPIKVVRSQLKKPVGVIYPHRRPSQVLLKNASFVRPIRQGLLKASQFPNMLKDKRGVFHKPEIW